MVKTKFFIRKDAALLVEQQNTLMQKLLDQQNTPVVAATVAVAPPSSKTEVYGDVKQAVAAPAMSFDEDVPYIPEADLSGATSIAFATDTQAFDEEDSVAKLSSIKRRK